MYRIYDIIIEAAGKKNKGTGQDALRGDEIQREEEKEKIIWQRRWELLWGIT